MHIYLSPHHDDVCFSIGSLAERQGGELVNVLTQSRYVAAPVALPTDFAARVAMVSDMRRAEDLAFARAAGLNRHDLRLMESSAQGHDPFDLAGLEAKVAEVSAPLIAYLLALLPEKSDPATVALYCPMGIGGHRDHLAVLTSVRDALPELSRRCAVWLYEDLHYASNAEARRSGLARAAQLLGGAELVPKVMRLSWMQARTKMRRIGLYASQHAEKPAMRAFTPASESVRGPHETIWRVLPASQ